jgi:hypothetical protein
MLSVRTPSIGELVVHIARERRHVIYGITMPSKSRFAGPSGLVTHTRQYPQPAMKPPLCFGYSMKG